MRFVTFKTPQARRFNYKPRYFNEEKDALERKKAALGLESNITHHEAMRMQFSRRWRKSSGEDKKGPLARGISYFFYGFVIFGGIYLIFFTDFVDKLIALFGIK